VSVELERREHVALVTLNRPDALNAMSPEMFDALDARLDEIDADEGVRAVVLTGAGEKAFCAGADISTMRTASAQEARAWGARGQGLAARIEHLAAPVVAAVNGYALGGGCELALAADLRFAAENAVLGHRPSLSNTSARSPSSCTLVPLRVIGISSSVMNSTRRGTL